MKSRHLLFVALLLLGMAACVERTRVEQRVVELPKGAPETSLATAEQICRELMEAGFAAKVQEGFPSLSPQQLREVFLRWNAGQFQTGRSVFITTGISYQGELPIAKEVAEYCADLVQAAVDRKFTKPVSP